MKLHVLRSLLCMSLLSLLIVPATLWAQTTGQITGTVRDNTGAVVSGANVIVTDPAKGVSRTTTSNTSGEYLVSGLGAATYDLNVASPGFKTFSAKGVVLQVGQKARVDVDLQVGAINTEVVVQGTQVAQVETQSSELSGVVNGKEITQLELNGRNFTQLVTLVPGVSNQTGQDEGTVGVYGNVAFSMNGGRTEYNNWELDGGDNMDNGSNSTLNVYPSVEAIGEFRVLTSNYGAQYGRNGSGTVEVETKSGTNTFHGDVYEFNRNDAYNARNYFNRSPDRKAGYKKNDYGYTIGGPVYIPNVYNTDRQKTFFFWSQEWRKDIVPGQVFNLAVPSLAERSGNFSDLCPNRATGSSVDCPINPATGAPYPGNQVPFNPSDPNVQGLLGMIPAPNALGPDGITPFFNASPSQPTNWREELLRLDQNIGSKHRLTFRYIHDSWDTITPIPLWTNQGSFPTIQTNFKGPGISLVARLTSNFTPTLLNEFVASYTADHIILNNIGNWQRPAGSTYGSLFAGSTTKALPGINLISTGPAYGGGFGEDAGYIPNGPYNSNPTYTYRDNLSKILGRHNLQFGAYVVTAQKNEFGGELSAGSVPGYITFEPSLATTTTGNPFADLLLGNMYSFGQQDHFVKYYNRYKIVEPYFQDDFHVTSRLTLNLGLRVSLFGTYREKLHQAFNFDPAHYVLGQTTYDPTTGTVSGLTANGLPASVSNLPNGIVQCGVTPGVPAGCMQGHLFNPAPRIGFAFDPTGNGRTAIRGGYGIFFEHTNGNEGNTESLENSPPLATTEKQLNIVGYSNIGAGFSPTFQPVFPLSVVEIPTKAIWPYVQQWHLDVQHEIATNTVLTLSYVGSKGTHLTAEGDRNQIFPLLGPNPFKQGEALNCPASQIPNPTTPSGVPITGDALVHFNVACGFTDPNTLRPLTGYSDITYLHNSASSVYHALQFSGRRQMGGLQLSVAYTYSHSIDDSSDRYDGGATVIDFYHPALFRASSNFDQRHIFNASYIWDVPIFKNPGLANKLLGGWQYSGIVSFATGSPFSVVFPGDNSGIADGLTSNGAFGDRVSNPNVGIPSVPGVLQLYNPNAYAPPTGLTLGDSGRNSLRNPNRTNLDMALFKRFAVNERASFEFRAEAFNVFNHTQFGYIAGSSGSAASNSSNLNSNTNNLSGGNFLQVLTAHNPRILQLGLKFLF